MTGATAWEFDDSKVQGRLDAIVTTLPQGAAAGLYRFGEMVIADAKSNYVPVKDGILRGSGFVEQPIVERGRVSVRIGFGGAAKAYAAVQHERLDYQHTTGGPKYLERPVLAHASEMLGYVAGSIAGAL